MSVFETLSPKQQTLIRRHLDLVIEANKVVNLTRIDDVEDAMVLHVEDSLRGMEELEEAPEGIYGDLGSGAGYPGIPLAIATGRQTVLIDSRKKKMEVVDTIVGKLNLADKINVYSGRAELLARTQSKRYAALTARALSQLPVLLELASPLLKKDGLLVLADARQVQHLVGMRCEHDRSFMLNGKYNRRILTYRKIEDPKIKLPRQEGLAQKHPLSEKQPST